MRAIIDFTQAKEIKKTLFFDDTDSCHILE